MSAFSGLDNNMISSIALGAFDSLVRLKNLGLASNQLSVIPSGALASLASLQQLCVCL
jgi:Leucine-rich repeat (LRR) protein